MTLSFVLIALLLASGLWMLCGVLFFHDASFEGSAELRRYGKWHEDKRDFWESSIMKALTKFASLFVFLDSNTEELLARQLNRAGLTLTPKEFTARRYVILFFGAIGAGVCGFMKFWLGVILCALLAGFGLMKQRDALQAKLKEKDEAISLELPRFVRTICRNLCGNRDIYAALISYRKVSGPVLSAELDILLAHMRRMPHWPIRRQAAAVPQAITVPAAPGILPLLPEATSVLPDRAVERAAAFPTPRPLPAGRFPAPTTVPIPIPLLAHTRVQAVRTPVSRRHITTMPREYRVPAIMAVSSPPQVQQAKPLLRRPCWA